MVTIKETRWAIPSSWSGTLVSLLPLWLLSVAITAEGFPSPPVPIALAITSFVLAIASSMVMLWKRWMTVELALYYLVPFILLFTFDEISTSYKTPFIILCALILTAGIVRYQHSRSALWRWLILLSAAVATVVMARHATVSFWHMVGDLGFVECFPDYQGCAPLTGKEIPWWILFFRLWPW